MNDFVNVMESHYVRIWYTWTLVPYWAWRWL